MEKTIELRPESLHWQIQVPITRTLSFTHTKDGALYINGAIGEIREMLDQMIATLDNDINALQFKK